MNYPGRYQSKSHYEWHITTRDGTFIELVFQDDFDIPSDDDTTCNNNYVTVLDNGDFESVKYCNAHAPGKEPIRSSFNMMKVVFRTGTGMVGTGFYAEYKAMNFEIDLDDHNRPSKLTGLLFLNDACKHKILATTGTLIHL